MSERDEQGAARAQVLMAAFMPSWEEMAPLLSLPTEEMWWRVRSLLGKPPWRRMVRAWPRLRELASAGRQLRVSSDLAQVVGLFRWERELLVPIIDHLVAEALAISSGTRQADEGLHDGTSEEQD